MTKIYLNYRRSTKDYEARFGRTVIRGDLWKAPAPYD